jgi:hypothetical protein
MNLGLVTFGEGNPVWKFSTSRLIKEAKISNFFSAAFDMSTSLNTFLQPDEKKFVLENKKGYGFWFWKPIVILEFLKINKELDGIVYMDAGCEINYTPESLMMFNVYKNQLSKCNALVFSTGVVEKNWTKSEVFKRLRVSIDDQESEQISATAFMMNKDFAYSFCEKWKTVMKESNFSMLDDSLIEENSELISHRHDQSIFSVLIKQESRVLIKSFSEANFSPNWKSGHNFPFWMRRNRTSRKADSKELADILLRLFQRLIGRIYRYKSNFISFKNFFIGSRI